MKKLIEEEYVKGDLAQLMLGTAKNELVISNDEIIFMKIDGDPIINKYLSHDKRNDFPYADIPMHKEQRTELYNMLFEMDKNYLVYELDTRINNIINNRFTRLDKGVLWNYEFASLDKHKKEQMMSRDEVKKVFDYFDYDSFFIINTLGKIEFAYTIKDGVRINTRLLPTEGEVRNYMAGKKKLTLYGGFFNILHNVMITSKNGNFKVCSFSLSVDEYGCYKMVTQDVILPDLINEVEKDEVYESTRRVNF